MRNRNIYCITLAQCPLMINYLGIKLVCYYISVEIIKLQDFVTNYVARKMCTRERSNNIPRAIKASFMVYNSVSKKRRGYLQFRMSRSELIILATRFMFIN